MQFLIQWENMKNNNSLLKEAIIEYKMQKISEKFIYQCIS